jgi:hypothetical protein
MSNRIEIEQSLLDIMNFFFQCLNYNAQLITLNTEPVYFHPSLDGSYQKIPPFPLPVNFETHRAERLPTLPTDRRGA